MTAHMLKRRSLLLGAAGATATQLTPFTAFAAAPMIAATGPGAFYEGHSNVLVPYFRNRTGGDVTLTQILSTELLAKLQAARGKPQFDVALMDDGPLLDGIKLGILERYPAERSPHYKDLPAAYQNEWGPKITVVPIGIAYNPKRVKRVPTKWTDLLSNEYKGKVGLTALNSSLGVTFLVDLARVNGGSEKDIEPGFKALKALLATAGAVTANLGAHAALFQQGQVDLAPYNLFGTLQLKAKGVDIEFAPIETGAPAWRTALCITKGAPQPAMALQYIDSHLAVEVQNALQGAPYFFVPTNRRVPLSKVIADAIGQKPDGTNSLVYLDWAVINEQRGAWIDRFNREIRV